MMHVSNLSGGLGSWAASKLVAQANGIDKLRLVFADTLIEDNDLYRFLVEGSANVFGINGVSNLAAQALKLPLVEDDRPAERKAGILAIRDLATAMIPGLVWLVEGRTPWEIFHDERYIGNSSVDPCSKILKRELIDAWCCANLVQSETRRYVGIDYSERHRFYGKTGKKGLRKLMVERGWIFEAPLCEPPYLSKYEVALWAEREGIDRPALYDDGFPHNNCGGFCVKSGQAGFARLLHLHPARFKFHEGKERAERVYLDKDVAIMSDRRGGKKLPLTMTAFRERSERGEPCDRLDRGGCSCFAGDE